MYVERHVCSLVANASGVAQAKTPIVTGQVLQIHYLKTNFADGVDITVSGETTGHVIWAGTNVNVATVVAPRMASVAAEDGAAALYASGGVAVRVPIHVAKERLVVDVVQAGNGTTGTVHIVIG